jgi:hypothetical protein
VVLSTAGQLQMEERTLNLDDHIANLGAAHELIGELLSDAKQLRNELSVSLVTSGIVALDPSSARVYHEYERHDVLPVGRVRHSPAAPRMTARERRDAILSMIRKIDGWFAPMEWATHHFPDPAVAACWKGRMQTECRSL